MKGGGRMERLALVRRHERLTAAIALRRAADETRAAEDRRRSEAARREELEREQALRAGRPAGAVEWLQGRGMVLEQLEREHIAGLQLRRLARTESLRRGTLRDAMVREEQSRLLAEKRQLAERDEDLRRDQKALDDLRGAGGDEPW